MNSEEDKSTSIRRWGDAHQFDAAPMQAHYDEKTGVLPKVTLVSMTSDPLGAIAAACRMYEGKPTYSLSDVTDDERLHYWNQAQATHLKAPLEFVDFHFFIEGVDRAFTHQMVRQRTAVFAQESMRFAVMGGGFLENTSLPPSLHGTMTDPEYHPDAAPSTKPEQRWRDTWDTAIDAVERAYTLLVESGMPAEEARGLLPHAMATRLNFKTNLRNLTDHAGNRLCTQAQFHWRLVFAQMAEAIRNYGVDHGSVRPDHAWQFERIAGIFRPVCYELGKCPFNATFDRDCSIKERVSANAEHGRPSSEWHLPLIDEQVVTDAPPLVEPILPQEWAMDPSAARKGAR